MASAAHSSAWPAAVSPLLAAELAAAPEAPLAAFPTALYLLLDRHDRVPRPGRRRPPTAHGSAAGAAVTGARLGVWPPAARSSWATAGSGCPSGTSSRCASGGPRASRPVCARPPLPTPPTPPTLPWPLPRASSRPPMSAARAVSPPTSPTALRGGAPCCRWPPSWVPGPASRRAATTPCAESSSPCAPWAVERPRGHGLGRRRGPRSGTCHDEPVGLPPRRCARRARGRAPRPRHRGRRRARPARRCPPCWRSATPLAQTSSPARRHHRRPGPPRPGAPVPVHPHLHTEGSQPCLTTSSCAAAPTTTR